MIRINIPRPVLSTDQELLSSGEENPEIKITESKNCKENKKNINVIRYYVRLYPVTLKS
ncbi:MAG: hypothetical protein M3R36_09625 [Bacteroidota bacterium]|nr:hypothetical protein [Bacteroidota bacterium]